MTARPPGVDRVRTVFLGSGAFAVPSLRALAAHDAVDLVAIVTAPPRPAGRGLHLERSPVHDAADAPVLTPSRLRDPEAVAEILDLEPALVVLADYGQIVPAALLDPPFGALNLHPSLLPRHRGASPIPAAIVAGDRETGVTLMRMDAGLDTGPIVAVERLPLDRVRDGARARGAARGPRRRPARPVAGAVAARRPPGDAPARGRRHADPPAAPRGRPARPLAAGDGPRTARPRLPAVARDVPRGGRRAPRRRRRVRRGIATGRRARPPRARRRPAGVHDDRRTPRARARHAARPQADVRSGLPAGPPPGPRLIRLVSPLELRRGPHVAAARARVRIDGDGG